MPPSGVFLTAEWRDLVMLNYEVDPDLLSSRVPAGTEIDFHEGKTYVSVVAFLFLNTRVMGVPVPFHRDFEEVNLRFYIRRGEKRGVAFIKELVPKWVIAKVARVLYNENYEAVPMRHRIGDRRYEYEWELDRWNRVHAVTEGEPFLPEAGAHEAFIAEHYWGYAAQRDGGTVEYQVEHPPWRIWNVKEAGLDADVAPLYGGDFVDVLKTPVSAFLAEGSPVRVHRGVRIQTTA